MATPRGIATNQTARFPSPPTMCPELSPGGRGYERQGPVLSGQTAPVHNLADNMPRAVGAAHRSTDNLLPVLPCRRR